MEINSNKKEKITNINFNECNHLKKRKIDNSTKNMAKVSLNIMDE